LTLGPNNKNVDTQEHKERVETAKARALRLRQSGCRLSVACETQTKYTRQQFKRKETVERLQESYGKQQAKLLNHS